MLKNGAKSFHGANSISSFHQSFGFHMDLRCLKITEKVSFSIASEASYVYVFNGPKLIENAKLASF